MLCPACGAGEACRLTAQDIRYLQDIMRRGIRSLDAPGGCPEDLFAALRSLAESRLDAPIRSGKMLV